MIGAIDIGCTKVAVGLIDSSFRVIARSEFPTSFFGDPNKSISSLHKIFSEMIAPIGGKLSGVGIACTGPVTGNEGIIGTVSALPDWMGFNIVSALTNAFNLRVELENDANAGAVGEFKHGYGQGAKRFVYVTIGTGVGVGYIFDGSLYRGADGIHPEFGHHTLDPNGPKCACGTNGCWESFVSGPALTTWYLSNSIDIHEDHSSLNARKICEAALHEEPVAKRAVERVGYYLGLGIANLITIFAPDIIVLGGGLMQSHSLFWEKLENTVKVNCNVEAAKNARVLKARLGIDTGLVGAAQIWLEKSK